VCAPSLTPFPPPPPLSPSPPSAPPQPTEASRKAERDTESKEGGRAGGKKEKEGGIVWEEGEESRNKFDPPLQRGDDSDSVMSWPGTSKESFARWACVCVCVRDMEMEMEMTMEGEEERE